MLLKMAKEILINGPVTASMISEAVERAGKFTDAGGHSVFIGQVRADNVTGKLVAAIEYSAYESMVKAEAEKIYKEILVAYNDVISIEIIHSAGIVKAGEISLFVIVSGGHRQQAIEACRQIVEMIKERFPVWKKELFEDKSADWKENPVN
jgi:molybdopterin synthase catalytic subunit